MRRVVCLLALVAVVGLCGCVKVEQHVTVRPDAKADAGFALRLPAAMGAMVGQLVGQPSGSSASANLPPGLELGQRDEGGETVLEVKLPAELLPPPMKSLYRVTTRERLLTKTYRLSIDPKAMNPRELIRMGQALQTPRATRPTIMPAQFSLPGLGGLDLTSPEGLQEALGMLGGLLGGQGGDVQGLLGQIEIATYVHMPGRLARTNGEQVDASTAKWAMEPKQTGEIITFAGDPLAAESEAGNSPRIDELARRLTEGHGLTVSTEDLLGLAARRLIPNPEVGQDEQPLVDADLYGQLAALAMGLDQTVGPQGTTAVMDRLGLLVDQPSLAQATKAAKRVPRLREHTAPAELPLDAVVEVLTR